MKDLDNILIGNIKNGDNESLKTFLEKYKKFLIGCSKKYKINLEELQQRTCEILINPNIHIDNCKGYLNVVFKNDFIKRQIYSFKNELCSDIYDYVLLSEDDYDNFIFESYISSFDDLTKKIFKMRFQRDLTYQEIASILDMNISKVYRIIEKNCTILKNSIKQ